MSSHSFSSGRDAIAVRVATGAAVGLVAGLIASFAMDRFQAVMQCSDDRDAEPATQQAADAAARVATGSPLPKRVKPVGGQIVHYGLGAALGAGYGAAAELVPRVTAGAGTAFAITTWVMLDEVAVPFVKLGDPPWQSPPKTQAYGLLSHIIFLLVAEQARRVLRQALHIERAQAA